MARESNQSHEYVINLLVAREWIKPGDSIERVIEKVRHPPDEVWPQEVGSLLVWSIAYKKHRGLIARIRGIGTLNGQYWLHVWIDDNGKVTKVELVEA